MSVRLFVVIALAFLCGAALATAQNLPAGGSKISEDEQVFEVYKGVFLDVPGDFMVDEGGKTLGSAIDLLRKGTPPAGIEMSRELHSVFITDGKAILQVQVAPIVGAEAEEMARNFGPGRTEALKKLQQDTEREIDGSGVQLSAPVHVETATIAGHPGFRIHIQGKRADGQKIVLDSDSIYTGRMFIQLRAVKVGSTKDPVLGDDADFHAELDRAKASLRFTAAPAAPTPAKKAGSGSGTVWDTFKNLGRDPAPAK